MPVTGTSWRMSVAIQPLADHRSRRNVTVLFVAQAFLGAQLPMIFIIGGLAGQSLASNICFATLPITFIVLGSMLSATPMSIARAPCRERA